MIYLRDIFAIVFIAVLSATFVIESTLHAGASECVGDHCLTHVSADASAHSDGAIPDQHTHSPSDAERGCCDQMLCQTLVLASQLLVSSPTGFESMIWDDADLLSKAGYPSHLDRPPNV